MSFILDALKKLEENRKRGEVPDLTTVHLQDNAPFKKRVLWPYLLLTVLILNAVIVTAWLRPWQEKEVVTAPSGFQETENITELEQVQDAASADSTLVNNEKIFENRQVNVAPTADEKTDEKISKDIVEPEEPINREKPLEKSDEEVIAAIGLEPTPEELGMLRNKIREEHDITDQMPMEEIIQPAEPDVIEPEDGDGFVEFSQLPDNVRNELPEITINAHIYSDNRSARIANINGYITREGDKVSAGLIVDEITTSGIIFRFKEYRFRMRAF